MPESLETSRHGRVLRVVLNRPEKRNALNAQLCRDLVRTLEQGFHDDAVGAILLSANGKHFCAGMDLSEVSAATAPDINEAISAAQEQLFTIGARADKPIVAAVAGASLGGGMGLVGNCHIVVAHPEATFGLTEIRIGLWPFLVFRALAAGLGERRVLELALTGRIFPASEAKEMGLVQELAADPQARAAEIARSLADSSPTTIRSGLAFAREVRGRDWATAGEIAHRARDQVFRSADFAEGLAAFREKRPPHWPSVRQEPH
jgi:enoyl-CoA hydratase/carnithine racemase